MSTYPSELSPENVLKMYYLLIYVTLKFPLINQKVRTHWKKFPQILPFQVLTSLYMRMRRSSYKSFHISAIFPLANQIPIKNYHHVMKMPIIICNSERSSGVNQAICFFFFDISSWCATKCIHIFFLKF